MRAVAKVCRRANASVVEERARFAWAGTIVDEVLGDEGNGRFFGGVRQVHAMCSHQGLQQGLGGRDGMQIGRKNEQQIGVTGMFVAVHVTCVSTRARTGTAQDDRTEPLQVGS
jgi:hypothetical protein